MAEADVFNVDQDFVAALAVPDLMAGVSRVSEDGPHCRLGPGTVAVRSVRLTARVMS